LDEDNEEFPRVAKEPIITKRLARKLHISNISFVNQDPILNYQKIDLINLNNFNSD
jgi:hypothetical protein